MNRYLWPFGRLSRMRELEVVVATMAGVVSGLEDAMVKATQEHQQTRLILELMNDRQDKRLDVLAAACGTKFAELDAKIVPQIILGRPVTPEEQAAHEDALASCSVQS